MVAAGRSSSLAPGLLPDGSAIQALGRMLREEAELSDIPSVIRGTAMNLIIAGILSLAFMGFAGLFAAGT